MLVRREAPWDGWHSVPSLDVTEHVCKWFYWILQSIIQSVLIECPLWTRSYLLSVLGIQAVKFKKCLSWFSTETMKTFYSLTYIYLSDVEAETPILWPPDVKSWLIWKDSDAGKVRAGGEEDNRGWDSWMASPTQWTWVWVNSWSWWWTGRPGMLQSMGLQSVRHDRATELNWTDT